MTEKLISFKTAKLAKEKGFSEKCTHYYVLDFSSFKSSGIPKQHGTPIEDNANILQLVKITENQHHLASAPTQSLLQKWLREKYNFHIDVYPNASGWQVNLDKTNGTHIQNVEDYNEGNIYEDALESGLFEALKLI